MGRSQQQQVWMRAACMPPPPPPGHAGRTCTAIGGCWATASIAIMACTALGACSALQALQAGRGLLRTLSGGRRAATQLGSPLARRTSQAGQPTGRRHLSLSARCEAAATMEAGLPAEIEHTVERIHCSPVRIVLYLGGGASQVRCRQPARRTAAQLLAAGHASPACASGTVLGASRLAGAPAPSAAAGGGVAAVGAGRVPHGAGHADSLQPRQPQGCAGQVARDVCQLRWVLGARWHGMRAGGCCCGAGGRACIGSNALAW